MAGRPTFLDLRGQKYFSTPEEMENFKKFMRIFNLMADDGVFFEGQLPSYVDDVMDIYINDGEFYEVFNGTKTDKKVEGEYDKLYVDVDATKNNLYRWDGNNFVPINEEVKYSTAEQTQTMLDKIFTNKNVS